jgi:hypothetical protein
LSDGSLKRVIVKNKKIELGSNFQDESHYITIAGHVMKKKRQKHKKTQPNKQTKRDKNTGTDQDMQSRQGGTDNTKQSNWSC